MDSSSLDSLEQARRAPDSANACPAEVDAARRAEAAADARLADIAETAGPVAHEFNNFLNTLLLHLAVLQLKLPEEAHAGLEEIRRQGMNIAELIQRFQNYRRRGKGSPGAIELNPAVRAASETLGKGETPLRLELAVEELPLYGFYGDLKRLCIFLLRNAVGAAATTSGAVVVRTERNGGRVILRVEDGGPPLEPEHAAHLFEPSAPGREGANPLEMAACRTLARRMNAQVRAEPAPEGGVALVVEWEAATPSLQQP
jgi:signal transduction histidine kinase